MHQELIETVNAGRLASVYFTKFLILDQFNKKQTQDIVNQAYDFLKEAEKRIGRLQVQMTDDEATIRMVNAKI